MKPFWLYMLRCADGSYYVGHTDDLEKRVAEHQAAAIPGHTCARRPVSLVYAAEMVTRDEAIQRERQLKGWSRAKKEALVRGDWERVHTLARGPDRVRPSTPLRYAQGERGGPSTPLRSAQGERTCGDATPRSAQGERTCGDATPRSAQGGTGELFDSAAPRPPIRSS